MAINMTHTMLFDVLLALFFVPKAFLHHHWFVWETVFSLGGVLTARFSMSPVLKLAGVVTAVVAVWQANNHFYWRSFWSDYHAESTVTLFNFAGVVLLPLAMLLPDGVAWARHVHGASPVKLSRQSESSGVSLA